MTTLSPRALEGASRGAEESPGGDGSAQHDVDRALSELLEEIRIAQMGAQILLGFLLAVAYTTALHDAQESDRALYAWAVGVTTAAVVLLMGTVPLHRLNFGRRARGEILVIGHVLALGGLVLLAGAIVLSVWMAARMALPASQATVVLPVCALVALVWLALPLVVRMRAGRSSGPPQA